MAALAVVRDLREHWAPASAEELERFETDVLSGVGVHVNVPTRVRMNVASS